MPRSIAPSRSAGASTWSVHDVVRSASQEPCGLFPHPRYRRRRRAGRYHGAQQPHRCPGSASQSANCRSTSCGCWLKRAMRRRNTTSGPCIEGATVLRLTRTCLPMFKRKQDSTSRHGGFSGQRIKDMLQRSMSWGSPTSLAFLASRGTTPRRSAGIGWRLSRVMPPRSSTSGSDMKTAGASRRTKREDDLLGRVGPNPPPFRKGSTRARRNKPHT